MSLLSERECRRRLGSVGVGRLGFTEGALPVIEPVSFTLNGEGEVVVHVGGGGVAGIAGGTIVAFEADDWNPSIHSGWSVSAVGVCRSVNDPGEIADLDRAGFTWGAPRPGRYLALRLARVRGREVAPQQGTLTGVSAGST